MDELDEALGVAPLESGGLVGVVRVVAARDDEPVVLASRRILPGNAENPKSRRRAREDGGVSARLELDGSRAQFR